MRRRKRNSYKFAGMKHSKRGKVSLALAMLSLFAGVGMVAFSVGSQGNATIYVGSAGLLSLCLSAVSLVIGLSSLREESYKLFPVLGSLCSVLVLAGWVAIYVLGFSA